MMIVSCVATEVVSFVNPLLFDFHNHDSVLIPTYFQNSAWNALQTDLLCCDYCEKAYHLKCHLPPLDAIPEGLWKCQECAALEYRRKFRCGECEACVRKECGECVNCLDKPKYGGLNRLKQKCIKKICPYMRFAPPAKKTPQSKKKKPSQRELKLQFAEKSQKVEVENRQVTCASVEKISKEKKKAKKRKRASVGQKSPRPSYSSSVNNATQSPSKRQKVGQHNVPDFTESSGASKQLLEKHDPEIDAIVDSKPLKGDATGEKIRGIIIKALKHQDSAKQEKACMQLTSMAAKRAANVAKIIRLGGLKMVSEVSVLIYQTGIVGCFDINMPISTCYFISTEGDERPPEKICTPIERNLLDDRVDVG